MTPIFECIFYNKKHTWVLLNLFPNSPLTLTKLLQLLFPLFSSFSSSPAKHPLDLSSVSCSNSSISQQLTAWGSAKRLLHCKQITLHFYTLSIFILFNIILFCFQLALLELHFNLHTSLLHAICFVALVSCGSRTEFENWFWHNFKVT